MANIFCVEDDTGIRELITCALQSGGYTAKGFPDGKSFSACTGRTAGIDPAGHHAAGRGRHLDSETTEIRCSNGRNSCHHAFGEVSEIDKVTGLENGADDYITKPFGIMELLSRVKAVLRRSHVQKPEQQQVLSAHDLTIDLNQRTVVYLETEIVLTYKEFELLSYLVRNRGSAISRDRLLEQVWGFSYEGETRTVDAHVKTLRQKLEAAGCTNLIHTVRGYGYKIGG